MLERLERSRSTQLHNGGRTLSEMKVGNQRIVVALIFAFCLMALPQSEASGCRSEIRESMAVRNQTTDNKQAQDAIRDSHPAPACCQSFDCESMAVRNQTTDNKQAQDANRESLEKLVERAQAAM